MHLGKRILSAMLSAVIAVGLCPSAAFAEQGSGGRLAVQAGSVLTTQAAMDESEPNDDFGHADKIQMNQYVYGEIGENWDADYYRVSLPQAGSVKVTLVNGAYNSNGWIGAEIFNGYYESVYVSGNNWCDTTRPATFSVNLKKGVNRIKIDGYGLPKNHPYHFKLTYNIPTTSLKVTTAKRAFTAKWTKKSGALKYQLRYAPNKSMSKAKVVNISKKSSSKKIAKLKAKKKYWVQVRVLKKIGGQTYYSPWSTKRAVITKK